MLREEAAITAYIQKERPIVVSINFIPEAFDVDFLFVTNSKRYVQQSSAINNVARKPKIIATSNVTKALGNFNFVLDYEELIDRSAVFIDNSFIMALKIMIKTSVKSATLAGFDGYSLSSESDYFSSKMEYEFSKRMGQEINSYVNRTLKEIHSTLNINFITPTLYNFGGI